MTRNPGEQLLLKTAFLPEHSRAISYNVKKDRQFSFENCRSYLLFLWHKVQQNQAFIACFPSNPQRPHNHKNRRNNRSKNHLDAHNPLHCKGR